MDDEQKKIAHNKKLYKPYSYGRLRIIAETQNIDIACRAAALEMLHEMEMTRVKQTFIISLLSLGVALLSLVVSAAPIFRALFHLCWGIV